MMTFILRLPKKLIFLFIILSIFFLPSYSGEEKEPNNTSKQANIICNDEYIIGHTGEKTDYGFTGDVDIFSFTAKSPGKLTIYGNVLAKYGPSEDEPAVRIDILNSKDLKAGDWKDSSGKFVSPLYTSKDTIKHIIINKSGTVYLKVDRYRSDAYYSFKIIYQEYSKSGEKTSFETIKEIEPDDLPKEAMKILLNQPVEGHTGNIGKYGTEGNKDYYTVEVPYPGKLTIFLTVEGKYGQEQGKPSVKLSIVNSDEMTSGSWKNPYTEKDENPVFYSGKQGKSIFIKKPGKLIFYIDRYEVNGYYKFKVVFKGGNNE